jgi:hypothetical protein
MLLVIPAKKMQQRYACILIQLSFFCVHYQPQTPLCSERRQSPADRRLGEKMLRHAHTHVKGGLRTFAAPGAKVGSADEAGVRSTHHCVVFRIATQQFSFVLQMGSGLTRPAWFLRPAVHPLAQSCPFRFQECPVPSKSPSWFASQWSHID